MFRFGMMPGTNKLTRVIKNTITHAITALYCPVTVLKRFLQLMLHFHGLRSRYFPYFSIFPVIKKNGSFVRKLRRTGEAKTMATIPMLVGHCNEAIATKSLQVKPLFLSSTLPYLVRIHTV